MAPRIGSKTRIAIEMDPVQNVVVYVIAGSIVISIIFYLENV